MKPIPQVNQKQEGQRLDRFLAESCQVSRKQAKQWIDQGRVFLKDRKIIIASWELKAGDQLSLREVGASVLPHKKRYLEIRYEDDDLLVVEKPPGVACESTAQTLSATLVDDINDYLKRTHPERPFHYVGLMHRLDRETSGLMVYTLSKRANKLSLQFKDHSIGRKYIALLEGALHPDHGRIDRALRKDLKSDGKKMEVLQPSRNRNQPGRAITEYRVLERYPVVTLVEARLHTGRTHQVRAHFASLGHPVLGDRLYGAKLEAPRHLLHSSSLEFLHPLTGKKLAFHSKPPKDFQKILEKFCRQSLRF